MTNTRIDLYTEAHLFVAAIRILNHLNKTPPDLDQVCRHLAISLERGGFILRRLVKEEIVETVDQPHGARLFVKTHQNIERFKTRRTQTDLDRALAAFRSGKQTVSEKIEMIRADQAKKKKDLFTKLDAQLKSAQKPKTHGQGK